MNWRKITMPPAAPGVAPEPAPILIPFRKFYEDEGYPKDFCVFFSADQDERVFFLSPVAASACDEFVKGLGSPYVVSPCEASAVFGELRVGDFKSSECQDSLK